MSAPTIEDVIDLCKEYGLAVAGPKSDLLRFLKAQFDDLEETREELENYECDHCDDFMRDAREAEQEAEWLRKELDDIRGPKPSPKLEGMEQEQR